MSMLTALYHQRMGPVIIFDKSTLEGLNADEATWLDQFFLTNITPLFFVETLADLEKKARGGRTPEDVVGSLAYRTPDLHSKPNVFHRTLLEGELSGQATIEMQRGVPVIGGGKYVDLGGKTGAFFDASPEEEALMRWQEHKFLEIEHTLAKKWREGLSNVNLEEIYAQYQISFAGRPKPKNLEEVKAWVTKYIDTPEQEAVFRQGLNSMDVIPSFQEEVLTRWRAAGSPPVKEFAPYLTHIISVDLFFQIAIGADLIGRGRASHTIDVAYLYYLPFCNVFTSNDRLHKAIVPLFLRPDQTFVPGGELKADLAALDAHYEALPAEEKEKGVYAFAPTPPHEITFLTTRLWDKYMASTWRDIKGHVPTPNAPIDKKFYDQIKELEEKAKTEGTAQPARSGESDQLVLKRRVAVNRGKWKRFPDIIVNRHKNAEGDWEQNA